MSIKTLKLIDTYKISFEKLNVGWVVECFEDDNEIKYYTTRVDNPHPLRIIRDDFLGHTLNETKITLAKRISTHPEFNAEVYKDILNEIFNELKINH